MPKTFFLNGVMANGLAIKIGFSDGGSFEQDKVYYNFLIPSFIAPHSLSSHDFYNEFADICVGDAWDDEREAEERYFSINYKNENRKISFVRDG